MSSLGDTMLVTITGLIHKHLGNETSEDLLRDLKPVIDQADHAVLEIKKLN
jgi:hypothetical protein